MTTVASVRTTSSNSSKFLPTSRRVYKVLKEYSLKLVDFNLFAQHLEEWVGKNLFSNTTAEEHHFSSPFSIDDLRTFDFALEGVLFQQLLRMPYPPYASDNLKEDEFLALEDFLHTAAEGLWHAFWHRNKPLPYFVSFPRYPGSKFYTVDKAISRGRLGGLCGAALMSKNKGSPHARWDDVVKFVLFKQNLVKGDECGLPPEVICEALFYAIHILLSRSLSKYNKITTDHVYVSVLDSNLGGVLKLGGDLGKLEVDLDNPYQSMVDWITCHAEVSISRVDRIWNKLGNVNWGDLGTLQILMAMFYSIVQWNGPPRKSMASLAAKHSLRLQKRRMESQVVENDNILVPYQHESSYNGEIVEVDNESNHDSKRKGRGLDLSPGQILMLEDQNHGIKSFQIQDFLNDGNGCSYIAVAADCHAQLLTLYVGAHPSRLEPSWEDMNLWYQVQRQTKVVNIFKEQGVSCKHLPEIIASGRIVHPGPCEKQSPKGRCDHPWCGTPMLVTCPVGETVSSIIAHDGPLSAEEAIRCCRDCLSALRSAKRANILHGDIRPENIIRIVEERGGRAWSVFVLISWGRAALEDRDSPALNLQFSSAHALQHGKLCPSSDLESLVYLLYYVCGGAMPQQDSMESALKWRQRSWAKRVIPQQVGEVSPILKAFADYVDGICGTPYAVDYDAWLKRLDRAVDGSAERGKMRLKDVADSASSSM
ncbi:hypothetical protein SASPL_125071 [Salvia splendens]|uniref:Fungal-type protein kinase domain-containing protein n=1 Tax=Salvia splendens TaxID=180675 RepID=A0A8X8ZPP9_SALSN|nr:hypothetical protein SASPL_125071 [Salvia splendens]